MDTWIMVVGGVLLLGAVAATLYMLNRSWGDFGRQPHTPPSGSRNAEWNLPERLAMPDEAPASAPSDGGSDLVPIVNPLVQRAAAQALGRGGPAARYVVRQGDTLFFDFSRIADPIQRRRARELMLDLNAGRNVDIRAMMQLVRELFT